MANPLLGQILGSVLGGGRSGGMGGTGPGGGGLGSILGGMLGGGSGGGSPFGMSRGGRGGNTALLAMLLPLAMQWMQRSGGVGNVLQRAGQRGYGRQASSWVSTGDNEAISADEVGDLVGRDELSRMSQQLGVGEDEVARGFAEVLPEVVHHLTPDGEVSDDVDQRLDAGQGSLSQMLSELRQREPG